MLEQSLVQIVIMYFIETHVWQRPKCVASRPAKYNKNIIFDFIVNGFRAVVKSHFFSSLQCRWRRCNDKFIDCVWCKILQRHFVDKKTPYTTLIVCVTKRKHWFQERRRFNSIRQGENWQERNTWRYSMESSDNVKLFRWPRLKCCYKTT